MTTDPAPHPDAAASPMSVEVDRLRMKHRRISDPRLYGLPPRLGPDICAEDLTRWPCAADRLFAQLDTARRALDGLKMRDVDGYGPCWCDQSDFDSRIHPHEDECERANAALGALAGRGRSG